MDPRVSNPSLAMSRSVLGAGMITGQSTVDLAGLVAVYGN